MTSHVQILTCGTFALTDTSRTLETLSIRVFPLLLVLKDFSGIYRDNKVLNYGVTVHAYTSHYCQHPCTILIMRKIFGSKLFWYLCIAACCFCYDQVRSVIQYYICGSQSLTQMFIEHHFYSTHTHTSVIHCC